MYSLKSTLIAMSSLPVFEEARPDDEPEENSATNVST